MNAGLHHGKCISLAAVSGEVETRRKALRTDIDSATVIGCAPMQACLAGSLLALDVMEVHDGVRDLAYAHDQRNGRHGLELAETGDSVLDVRIPVRVRWVLEGGFDLGDEAADIAVAVALSPKAAASSVAKRSGASIIIGLHQRVVTDPSALRVERAREREAASNYLASALADVCAFG